MFLFLWQLLAILEKVVTFCCNLTSISIIRKCVCYCSCNGVQKCQTVEVTHHNNKQLREKKPLTIQEVLVIEQVVKWSFDFEVHTQYVIVRGADVHQYRMQCTLDYVLGYLIDPQLSGGSKSRRSYHSPTYPEHRKRSFHKYFEKKSHIYPFKDLPWQVYQDFLMSSSSLCSMLYQLLCLRILISNNNKYLLNYLLVLPHIQFKHGI